ncbi:MAG: ABC transporter permease [Azospirillum sp.]|nr:ABC transporter permease [Azospirillum sp.]
MAWIAPVLAVGLTLGASLALFAGLGFPPLAAIHAYFVQPISSLRGLAELGVKATPLALCALGLGIGFRANVWNIGAEGQLTMGALAGGGVALACHGSGGWWLLPAMLAAGIAGGMAWAAIPAFLRNRYHTSEILTSLMLTYVAALFHAWLIHGPLRDPDGMGFPESRLFEPDALLPMLLPGTRLHIGALFVVVAMAAAWLLLARSFLGFQLKVAGLAPQAAALAGFDRHRLVWFSLLVSGGLAGLAGVVEVAGPIGQLSTTISPGYGFTAIIVAFLGRLHPIGMVLAALVMALSYLGGEAAQIALGLPQAVTGVFQGMLLFFLLASDVLVHYRVRRATPPLPG